MRTVTVAGIRVWPYDILCASIKNHVPGYLASLALALARL